MHDGPVSTGTGLFDHPTAQGAPEDAERRRFTPPVGPIDAWRDGDLWRATGIRYARAERWGVPEPEPDHTQPLAATRWAAAPPQTTDATGEALYSPLRRDLDVDEHCQRLSILAPADVADDEALPVVVWIHGGSYIFGTGDSSITDPDDLVREQRLVAVTVTYRLGALGYVGTDSRPANLGLLDQAQALRWVRRNIGAFGGDPENVTAIGESAGADAIVHLLAAFPDEPLVDRAILQSPPLGIRRRRERMARATARVVAALDESSTHEDILAIEKPVTATALRYGLVGSMPFGIEYGREPMPPEDEVEAAWAQVAPRVPIIITTMGTEFSFFSRQVGLIERAGRAAGFDRRVLEPLEGWFSRAIFSRAIDEFARDWAAAGGDARRGEITWSAPGNAFRSPHGLDVLLQFGSREVWEGSALLRGSRWEDFVHAGQVLRAAWGAFARGEDPGQGEEGILSLRAVDAAE